MAEGKKKGGDISLTSTGVLALALAVFGLIWAGPSPLSDERPPGQTESYTNKEKVQNVRARMWQDPLGAALKDAKRANSGQRSAQFQLSGNQLTVVTEEVQTRADSHSPKNSIHRAVDGKRLDKKGIFLLAAMLPGGPYPEEEEGRRRKRYAILSALATLGFAPVETEHIGYFVPNLTTWNLPKVVPFELFDLEQSDQILKQGDQSRGPDKQQMRVVVLWLDDGYFNRHMEKKVESIFGQTVPEGARNRIVGRAVIGPNTSNQLRTLLAESEGKSLTAPFFAAGATVGPALLPQNGRANNLFRTIADDQKISKALVGELNLRHIELAEDHVLLISEWDTFYGRSLPETFAMEYAGPKARCQSLEARVDNDHRQNVHQTRGDDAPNVHCVHYMRGIDGKLQEDSGKTDSASNASAKAEVVQLNNNIDRPSGNHQKDYLRRLVDEVRKLDSNIRNSRIPNPVKNNGISAIGILGSDVYDKLMILQALRPFFPGKIFFTTDLDAAYFAPSQLPYTHNLIVASSFGLNLAAGLQGSIPPFRDSYQTAAFFSTQVAISKAIAESHEVDKGLLRQTSLSAVSISQTELDEWLSEPRIFEIGRKGAVDLSTEQTPKNLSECANFASLCTQIHPDPDKNPYKEALRPVDSLLAASLLLGFVLLYTMSWKLRWLPPSFNEFVSRIEPGRYDMNLDDAQKTALGKWKTTWRLIVSWALHTISRAAAMLPLFMVGLAIVGGVYLVLFHVGKDEPFYLWNGVSIWPSNLLVFLAIVIALWSYRYGRDQLKRNDQGLEKAFDLEPNVTDKFGKADWPLTVHGWENKIDGERIQVSRLWRDYQNYGDQSARFARAAINTCIFTLFGLTAVMLSGGLPVPARGNSFYVDVFLEMACVLVVVFLIMWVVDAARIFSRFIEHLAHHKESHWSGECARKWGLGWPREHVMYLIDLQFVAQYTKGIEKFIWLPIPSLLLAGLARSSFFDNWTFSAGLLLAFGILLLYLFSIAFFLQYGAKRMRAKAIRQLSGELRELRGKGGEEGEIAKLEKMIGEINGIDDGAFTPFMQQPMVQALLAFLSGSGGLIVLMDSFF